ncbi:MAG TPA: hypothetical protein VFP59_13395 [Candidatus Angelobacter sp.]|nr:hypothetical protein [Candidatus Angelobacter sp.]
MKNWVIPIAVLGVSGLGLLFISERGREQVRDFFDRLLEHGDPLGEFNNFVDEQLNAIQRALDSLSKALEEPQG